MAGTNKSFTINIKSGKMYIGDLCYALSDDIYDGVWGNQGHYEDGKYETQNGEFAMVGTAYGDGCYLGSDGMEYPVDAGIIGICDASLVNKDVHGYGTIVDATGEANMEFVKPNSKQTQYTMFLPKGTLYVSDQLSYSHEIGHIPELDLVRKSYLEYTEALPIFMEYLCELRRHPDKKEALDYFLIERLPMEQSEASDILKIYKNTEHPNELIRLYHQQLFADYYKYLESLEFVLQLIDRMDSDKEAVGKEIEAIIMGKSLIETARSLDIETDGCERTLKEYKRMSR